MSLTTYYTARGTSSNGKIAPQFKQRPSKAKAQQRDCCCCPSGFYPSPSPHHPSSAIAAAAAAAHTTYS